MPAAETLGRMAAGIAIPPLTAEQERPAPLPSWGPDEPAEGALARTGAQLLACRADKADLVITYNDVRSRFAAAGGGEAARR